MKLFLLFIGFGLFFSSVSLAVAGEDAGLRYIQTRGMVRCGTDLQTKAFAYKDEDGFWHGFDVDICKAISYAVFNRADRFQMVNIPQENISQALKTNKIDVMLSGSNYSAKDEITYKFMPVDILYYDTQTFLARKIPDAKSMEAYKGAKVCIVADTVDYHNVLNYSDTYKLDFNFLSFKTKKRAEEAFLLNRCQLLTGNKLVLQALKDKRFAHKDDITILPEPIALKPIYALVDKNNNSLRIIIKWVLNALKLSEEHDISSQNINIFIGTKNISLQNLLGDNPSLWAKFGLSPNWLRNATSDIGNFGEIYERNFGKNSDLKIERNENNLLKNGGLIVNEPFI